MNPKKTEVRKGFIESLSNFMIDSDELTREDLLEALAGEGIDTAELMKKVKEIAENESAKIRLAWREKAAARRLELERQLELKSSQNITQKASDLWGKARKIISGSCGVEAQKYAETYFRNRNSISEKDLESLLEDMDNLKILEKLNEKEEQ
ncbi:MAG: hypothetical protein Q7J27_09465 [Syntrophales bacterium]|nr:hypothetical protein [Syntrophales bacterium]